MTSQEPTGGAQDDLRGATQEGVAVPPGREKPCGLAPAHTCSSQRQGAQKHLGAQRAAPPLATPASCCAVTQLLLCQAVACPVLRAGR